MRALWLADVIRDGGMQVVEVAGWQTRGSDNWGPVKALMAHHTATPASRPGDYPSLAIVRDGRLPPDPSPVPGPLSQLGLGRSGTVYVIASGKANHAGVGRTPPGVVTFAGSTESLGCEAEHPGGNAPWTPRQYDAYVQLFSIVADHLNLKTSQVVGHKEWATPPGRKPDPTFPMGSFRADIDRVRSPDMATIPRDAKADDGDPTLAPTVQRAIAAGVATVHTQAGGVTFNDEMLTFIDRAAGLDARARIAALEDQVVELRSMIAAGGIPFGATVRLDKP